MWPEKDLRRRIWVCPNRLSSFHIQEENVLVKHFFFFSTCLQLIVALFSDLFVNKIVNTVPNSDIIKIKKRPQSIIMIVIADQDNTLFGCGKFNEQY